MVVSAFVEPLLMFTPKLRGCTAWIKTWRNTTLFFEVYIKYWMLRFLVHKSHWYLVSPTCPRWRRDPATSGPGLEDALSKPNNTPGRAELDSGSHCKAVVPAAVLGLHESSCLQRGKRTHMIRVVRGYMVNWSSCFKVICLNPCVYDHLSFDWQTRANSHPTLSIPNKGTRQRKVS